MERKNVWETYTKEDEIKLESLSEAYKNFLNEGKTERECAEQIVKEAREKGYRPLSDWQESGRKLQTGDKVYVVGKKKIVALFQIGKAPIQEGMNILCAHIDSPRLDIKQNPLYEDTYFAFLDTH